MGENNTKLLAFLLVQLSTEISSVLTFTSFGNAITKHHTVQRLLDIPIVTRAFLLTTRCCMWTEGIPVKKEPNTLSSRFSPKIKNNRKVCSSALGKLLMLRTSLRYILFDTKFACRRKRLTPRVVSPHSGLFSLGRCQIDPFQDNCSYACLIFSTSGWKDVRCRAIRRIYLSVNNVCAYAPTTRSAKFNCTRFTLS